MSQNNAQGCQTQQYFVQSTYPAGIHEISDNESDDIIDQSDSEAVELIMDIVDLTGAEEDNTIAEADLQAATSPSTYPHLSKQKAGDRNGAPNARNGQIKLPCVIVDNISFENLLLHTGESVQLKNEDDTRSRTRILYICGIIHDLSTDKVRLRGHVMYRNTNTGGMLPSKLNEVYLTMDQDLDDRRSIYEQSAIDVDLEDVVKTRLVVFTATDFPASSFREHIKLNKNRQDDATYQAQRAEVRENGQLVCRYVFIRRYGTARARVQTPNKPVVAELRRLYSGENPRGVPLARLRSHDFNRSPKDIITYGSGFAGPGGDSEGARLAGAKNLYAWDHDPRSCLTHEMNHTGSIVFKQAADEMCAAPVGCIPWVHICHLSCPCQTWSPAHTHAGQNDHANSAALFTPLTYLKANKPRYHTQEQTAGLLRGHPRFFAALVNQIVAAGYNVKWTLTNFKDYGLASNRDRLVIFAAQIGTPIPDFPAKTHGIGPSLQPYNTLGDAIAQVPQDASWHLNTVAAYSVPRAPYDGRCFAPCITTSTTLPHPSGLRPLSIRELAALNGFPNTYKFPPKGEVFATNLREQIGNAVPPLVWQKFVKKIIESDLAFRQGRIDESGQAVLRNAFAPSYEAEPVDLTGDDHDDLYD